MSAPVKLAAGSGNLNTLVANTVTGGTSISRRLYKRGTLSCQFDFTAATATLTMAALWQVSHDAVTWINIAPEATNQATVVVTTGTAAIVSLVLPPPRGAEAWEYVRPAVRNAVATGAAGDLYVFTAQFEHRDQFDA